MPGEGGVSGPRDGREGTVGNHKSAPRRGVGEQEPLRRRRQVGGKEGGRRRKEVSREDATAGGGAGLGIRQRDCSSAWWGRGLQCHSFWGSGACVLGRARHLPAAPRYHPECKGGGRGRGRAAESSPKRDANQQSWEKVNKGHAPCRRPASAHPPLRPPPPVHFHSRSASSPAGLPRSPGGLLSPTRVRTLPAWAAHPALTWEGCPPPLKEEEEKKKN